MNSPRPISTDHPRRTCRFRLNALYCVRTNTRRRSLFRQFESVTSMMRYTPPKGTAGLARSRVNGQSRSPWPPASSTPSTLRITGIQKTLDSAQPQLYSTARTLSACAAFPSRGGSQTCPRRKVTTHHSVMLGRALSEISPRLAEVAGPKNNSPDNNLDNHLRSGYITAVRPPYTILTLTCGVALDRSC